MTAGAIAAALHRLNSLPEADAEAALLRCCGARRWAAAMRRFRPFHTGEALFDAASDVWWALTPDDWRQAFAAHPRIGERTRSDTWSYQEQAGTEHAPGEVLEELDALNAEYEARFGYTFIVSASGRSAAGMLAELQRRIENAPTDELREAAREQERITELRLRKLLAEPGTEL